MRPALPALLRTFLLALSLTTLLGACALIGLSEPRGHKFSARLSGRAQVPPTPATGTGSLEAWLDQDTHLLRWRVSYSGLTGPVRAAHFHGPGVSGQTAPVVIPFEGDLSSPIEGQATLSAEQAAALVSGKWYVNLHTENFPAGEIRGQASLNR